MSLDAGAIIGSQRFFLVESKGGPRRDALSIDARRLRPKVGSRIGFLRVTGTRLATDDLGLFGQSTTAPVHNKTGHLGVKRGISRSPPQHRPPPLPLE